MNTTSEHMIGIYKITSPTGRVYIGQSVDLARRKKEHFKYNIDKYDTPLYYSIRKHGPESHTFRVLEECMSYQLNERERYYQDKYDTFNDGLNAKLTETDDKSGRLSEEHRAKLSDIHKGHSYHTPEQRKSISEFNRQRWANDKSYRARMSRIDRTGQAKWMLEARKDIPSDEWGAKISEAKKAAYADDDYRLKATSTNRIELKLTDISGNEIERFESKRTLMEYIKAKTGRVDPATIKRAIDTPGKVYKGYLIEKI